MPDVFVNYRTGDEEATATLIAGELSRRFGDEAIFKASKSITPGQRFPDQLVTAVRRSSAVLVVIGEHWTEAESRNGGRALDDPEDWTRREILEALDSGALVIPVLVGRATRLDAAALPPELAELADFQYRRFSHRNDRADLARLADDLAGLVPRLAAVDTERTPAEQPSPGHQGNTAGGEVRGSQTQARDVSQRLRGSIGHLAGDLGSFVNEPQGPVNTGPGEQHNGPRFHGDGMGVSYVAGDNSGTVRQTSGRESRREDQDR
ncbi:toll/interleukin-1 receptor domain-containing protein [Streptomyces sp. NPDC059816]|uniref:toll/interleukin-1 receptor domain-containing protein n=1 Tax=Streptomyces sp. NPDC059816 TaxID=3346960 RepID=UPI0036535445